MRHFRRKISSHWLWTTLSIALAAILIVGAILFFFMLGLPNTDSLKQVQYSEPLRIYANDGQLLAQYGSERRIPITFAEVPPQLVNAVLATEDRRYYDHPGVDLIGIGRAALAVISSGKKVQGASTITMQVARNFFLSRRKTYGRKLEEILLAIKIDHEFSKQKVLELYLNKIYFGNHAYGVAAAAEIYYGKKLNDLTLAQMAMIAGLPQAPSANNPVANKEAAKKRRSHVLERMLTAGFISKQQFATADSAALTASYHYKDVAITAPYAAEMIRQKVVAKYGAKTAYHAGIIVQTTIDPHLQKLAKSTLRKGLIDYSERHGWVGAAANIPDASAWPSALQKLPVIAPLQPALVSAVQAQSVSVVTKDGSTHTINWDGLSWAKPRTGSNMFGPEPKTASDILKVGDLIEIRQQNQQWRLSQIPQVQGSIISTNPKNGAIEAVQGGFAYNLSNFDRALQAVRQPGSCFKPFVYSAALNKGFTLASMINDAPVVIKDSGENALWRPDNDNFRFYGPTRLRLGLIFSRNLVSVRLLQLIGVQYALNYIQQFGFDTSKLPHSLSLALGSGETTPIDIARGYAVFANGGYLIEPFVIQNISTTAGKMLYQHQVVNAGDNDPAITVQNAYIMDQALHDVIKHGTGQAAKVLKRSDLAGKTGTTNKQVDAWFSGFNGSLVSIVWIGYDDEQRSLHEYGAKAALPIWIDFMRGALQGTPSSTLPEPSGIISLPIDPTTGLATSSSNPKSIFEVFRKQYAPTQSAISANGASNPDANAAKNGGDLDGLF
jgi:penicillin-binding protein 1A